MINFPVELRDIVYFLLAIIAIYVIRFWLIKIYFRVRQIAKILEVICDELRRRG